MILTVGLTVVLWIPYILAHIANVGEMRAVRAVAVAVLYQAGTHGGKSAGHGNYTLR